MKTQEMSKALRAFAEVAEGAGAEELRCLAAVFEADKNETVAARVRQILNRWPPHHAHPARLRKRLVAIASSLSACGAKKQAADFEAILALFDGAGTASVESFVEEIVATLKAPPVKASQTGKRAQSLDHALASELAEELANTLLDPEAFARIAERLHDSKLVSTPTLAAVANQFLGNSKRYTGRKAAIEDIKKRQKMDARSHARGKALDRLGV